LVLASQTAMQTSSGSAQNTRVIEAKHPLVSVADRTPEINRVEAPEESPVGSPDNNLFVDYPMAEYLPARPERSQPPVEFADLVSDDAEGTSEDEASQTEPVNKALDKAIARLADDQQPQEPKVEDVSEAEHSALPNVKTEPALPLEMQTGPVTPVVKTPQNHPEVVLANLTVKKTWNQNGKQVGNIRVEVEETLGHYAEWLNVSAREIRRLNGFRYGGALHLNQKIKIPLHRITQEEFIEKRFEYHQELAEDFFASYRIEKVLTYSIKRGDNIWTLSHQEFEVPLWLIKRYNAGVDFGALIPSQKLLIPIIEKNV
jgi:nucleoid-associated protein YgaU